MSFKRLFGVIFFIFIFIFLSHLVYISSVKAQSCGGGSYWCGNIESWWHFRNSSDPCDPISDGNNCIYESQCVDRSSGSCSSRTNANLCANPCPNSPCTVANNCSWNGGPPPTTSGGASGCTSDSQCDGCLSCINGVCSSASDYYCQQWNGSCSVCYSSGSCSPSSCPPPPTATPTPTPCPTSSRVYNQCKYGSPGTTCGGTTFSGFVSERITEVTNLCNGAKSYACSGFTVCSCGCGDVTAGSCNPSSSCSAPTPTATKTPTPTPNNCGGSNKPGGAVCCSNTECNSNWCNGGVCEPPTSCDTPYNRAAGASCTCNQQCSSNWCNGGKCNASPPTATPTPRPTTPPPPPTCNEPSTDTCGNGICSATEKCGQSNQCQRDCGSCSSCSSCGSASNKPNGCSCSSDSQCGSGCCDTLNNKCQACGGTSGLTTTTTGGTSKTTTIGSTTSSVPTATPTVRPTATPTPRAGEITGHIYNAATGRALGGVSVRLQNSSATKLDSGSDFRFTNLANGTRWELRVLLNSQQTADGWKVTSPSSGYYSNVSPGSIRDFYVCPGVSGCSGGTTTTTGSTTGLTTGFTFPRPPTATPTPAGTPIDICGGSGCSGGGTTTGSSTSGGGSGGIGGIVIDSGNNNCESGTTQYTGPGQVQLFRNTPTSQIFPRVNLNSSGGYAVSGNTFSGRHTLVVSGLENGYKVNTVRDRTRGDTDFARAYSSGYIFNLLPPNSEQIDFCISADTAWFQTDYGDVRFGDLNNPVPVGQRASSQWNTQQASVFYSTISQGNLGGDTTPKWKVSGEYDYNGLSIGKTGSTSYTYYLAQARRQGVPVDSLNCLTSSHCDINIQKQNFRIGQQGNIYTYTSKGSGTGELVITSYRQDPGTRVIILVDGDLRISTNITIPSDNSSLVIFAASGDIIFDSSVGNYPANSATVNVGGIYTAERNIIIEKNPNLDCNSSNPAERDKQLVVSGSLIANALRPFDRNIATGGKVVQQRSLCQENATNPSLVVKSRFSFVTALTDFYKITREKWSEVQP